MPLRDAPNGLDDPGIRRNRRFPAVGALVFFAALTRSSPTVDDVTFVVLRITVPATLAYELARRWR